MALAPWPASPRRLVLVAVLEVAPMTAEEEAPAALFDVEELAKPLGNGRGEAGLHRALVAAEELAIIGPADAGLVAAALIAARALDRAERMADKSAVYAVAQLLPPFQKALHGLRLPAEVAPMGAPQLQDAGEGQTDRASWLSDELGPS